VELPRGIKARRASEDCVFLAFGYAILADHEYMVPVSGYDTYTIVHKLTPLYGENSQTPVAYLRVAIHDRGDLG
jgi:hypothetical protein